MCSPLLSMCRFVPIASSKTSGRCFRLGFYRCDCVVAQAKDANPLQKALANNVRNYQIVGGEAGVGRLENLVELIPGLLWVRAAATCRPRNATVTDVDIEDVFLEVGPFRFRTLFGTGRRLPFQIWYG
jgi:hypothetical protein